MIRILTHLGPVLTLIALSAAVCAGLGHRFQWWTFGSGFLILKWAVYAALCALVISAVGTFLTWPGSGRAGFVWAVLSCILSASLISLPAYWLYQARKVPRIHDITTDIVNPPQFKSILPLRQDAPNTTKYGGPDVGRQQQAAYPEIVTAYLLDGTEESFHKTLAVAKSLGWKIVAAVPEEKRIEATDTTFWFGFKDDIVIRIRPQGDGTRLDIRSVSREGVSDVGTNARRIRTFLKPILPKSLE